MDEREYTYCLAACERRDCPKNGCQVPDKGHFVPKFRDYSDKCGGYRQPKDKVSESKYAILRWLRGITVGEVAYKSRTELHRRFMRETGVKCAVGMFTRTVNAEFGTRLASVMFDKKEYGIYVPAGVKAKRGCASGKYGLKCVEDIFSGDITT